jgi:hypothetical protein
MWLVGSQVTPGTYRTQAQSGCFWARLRDASGQIGSTIANDFVSSAGQILVSISDTDFAFQTDQECGTWAP